MSIQIPVRLGPAELTLIEQLTAAGATQEAARLAGSGLPTRRVESYHFTDLKMLWRNVPPAARAGDGHGEPALLIPGAEVHSIVNGRVMSPHKTAGSALSERDDVLVHLNVGLARETLTLEVGKDSVIQIDRRSEGGAGHSASSAHVFVADGVTATIVETYSGSDAAHVANHATYLAVGRGATVTHVAVDLSAAETTMFATHEYHLADDGKLRSLAIHVGSGLARTNIVARLEGQGADTQLTGLNLVDDGQHSDMTLEVTHAVPHTSGKPLYKQIGRGRSTAVFQGRILVARDAQKTDAKMSMNGLMLSDEASILSKPELEIYADDVVCGHGSTCGALDETSLFYLMSRGVPKAEAETMLVRAFLAELVDPIADEGLREALTGVIEGWLAGPK
jgi:Fe-S cluster assembly protein SufD